MRLTQQILLASERTRWNVDDVRTGPTPIYRYSSQLGPCEQNRRQSQNIRGWSNYCMSGQIRIRCTRIKYIELTQNHWTTPNACWFGWNQPTAKRKWRKFVHYMVEGVLCTMHAQRPHSHTHTGTTVCGVADCLCRIFSICGSLGVYGKYMERSAIANTYRHIYIYIYRGWLLYTY